MKAVFYKFQVLLLVLATCFLSACALFNSSGADDSVDMTPRLIVATESTDFADIVENVRSAVVGISASSGTGYSVGSGVAVKAGGYIITNQHVISGASVITLFYADKTKGNGTLLWQDSSLDIAIVKGEKDMPYLEFEDASLASVGDEVIAIGTPLTLQFKHTVTKGIISALNRTLEIDSMAGATYLQNLIQHDASINPGNSGGPLISKNGKLLGINTLKASDAEGIGFAIPIDVGGAIVERISIDNDYEAPYLGVFGFDADIAEYYGEESNNGTGVYVLSVDKRGTASKSGLREGDTIISVGGKKIESMLDLRISLFNFSIGEKIIMEVVRDGKRENIEFVGSEREDI